MPTFGEDAPNGNGSEGRDGSSSFPFASSPSLAPGKRRQRSSPYRPHPGSPETPPAKRDQHQFLPAHQRNMVEQELADMTVLAIRVDMKDSSRSDEDNLPHTPPRHQSAPALNLSCGRYCYEPSLKLASTPGTVAVCRIPHSLEPPTPQLWMQMPVVDKHTPCPHANADLKKYWIQRRRLFSRFDQGIQLDDQGWFSVTPEQIADHVSNRLIELYQCSNQQIVLLDCFCGCGGNAISFAKLPNVTVIGVDIDRSKLQKAAHNASIYQIPPEKLILIECNVLFILEHCFRDGNFVLDQPLASPEAIDALMAAMPAPVHTEIYAGYQIGGIDLLPRKLGAVFMDPPWGGVDYEVFGKNGYDLQRNMMIERPAQPAQKRTPGDGMDGFFDSFHATPRNKEERKAQFNSSLDETNCANGSQLLTLAAAATATRWVIFDIPRNTSRTSLGQAALAAGYRGNCKLEEHYLNGRLKTVTAYFGCDWSCN